MLMNFVTEQDEAVHPASFDMATLLDWLVEEHAVLAAEGARGADPVRGRISGAEIDSRRVRPGQLFVALPGAQSHGARHVAEALAAGATCALVGRHDRDLVPSTADRQRIVLVDEPVSALGRLATAQRRRLAPTVVAITGSAGKTTAKEMVADVLAVDRPVHRTPGNYNNHLGLPLTLLGLSEAHSTAVVEIGMSAPGEIATLCRICAPDLGVLTGIGRAHLAGLGCRAAIIEAKLELADALRPDGRLFLPADDAELLDAARRRGIELVTVGEAGPSDLRLERLAPVEEGWQAELSGMGFDGVPVVIPVAAPRLVTNGLLALAVGRAFDIEPGAAAAALAGFEPPAHRLQIRRAAGIQVLDDCYNANPESMLAAIEALELRPAARRIAVLGDMRELGEASAAAHRETGERIARVASHLFLIGEEAHHVAAGATSAGLAAAHITIAADLVELGRLVTAHLRSGDVVLVKASRALTLERVVDVILSQARGEEN